jgi:cell division protein FtsQ
MRRKKESTSRAEKIRERRSKRSRKTTKRQRELNSTMAPQMPPVMVRGGVYAPDRNKAKRKKSKTLKKRYDIALATPGVEIRLPSLPVVRFGWRFLSFLLMVGFLVLIYYFMTSPIFQIQMVDVKGAIRLTSEEINRTLNIYNKPVFTLNPDHLASSLSTMYPELKDVAVQISFPASVVIHVSERIPLIVWHQDSSTRLIDGDGFAFPVRGELEKLVAVKAYASPPKPASIDVNNETIDLSGEYQAFIHPTLVSGILVMRSQAPEGTELVYDPDFGLGWKDARGWDVFFGMDASEIDSKLMIYNSIVKNLQQDGRTPVLINIEHVHAPYYRLEQ